ncbi:MAG: hypothetical protein IJV82_01180 [Oscillospiraceae bacterium]|nr:hypothetical protein [Oscillospiraceae bacterium]
MDIIASDQPIFGLGGWEEHENYSRPGMAPAKREAGKKSEGDDALRSMRRARAKVRRLALANDFTHFVTLTLSPEKIDRYDGKAIVRALGQWADNMVRRKGLRYVLVPERHQDSAFHFHGFFAGAGLELVDSGHLIGGRTAYNLPQWSLGFSTAQELYGDYTAAVAYVCKYIGKQDGERPLGRWYYSGGALKEPAKEYVDFAYSEIQAEGQGIEFDIPGRKIYVIHTKMEDF